MVPIVLQHGLFGFGQFELAKLKLSYFRRIDDALLERGHPLIVSRVHPTGPIRLRAAQLKRTILQQIEARRIEQRVVIIAHSMGGLDARYMVSRLGMASHVAAIVTVCTPHRGSPYADWCLKNLGKRLGGLKVMNLLGLDVRAVSDLSVESCARFNECVPDHPDVRYYSISAARPWHHVPPFLLHSHRLIYDREGDNDGLVSVASARWGQHLETWPADHLHVINKRLVPEIKNRTGDIVPYYLRALDRILVSDGLL
ncbi:esterase/lipase family protein [Fontivita pretiosa]|uniref:esterase/lipase family protein n=1 Tax=Fontivita pretiosa TaxID=2989684 RepID=UPI003D1741E6